MYRWGVLNSTAATVYLTASSIPLIPSIVSEGLCTLFNKQANHVFPLKKLDTPRRIMAGSKENLCQAKSADLFPLTIVFVLAYSHGLFYLIRYLLIYPKILHSYTIYWKYNDFFSAPVLLLERPDSNPQPLPQTFSAHTTWHSSATMHIVLSKQSWFKSREVQYRICI